MSHCASITLDLGWLERGQQVRNTLHQVVLLCHSPPEYGVTWHLSLPLVASYRD